MQEVNRMAAPSSYDVEFETILTQHRLVNLIQANRLGDLGWRVQIALEDIIAQIFRWSLYRYHPIRAQLRETPLT